MSGTWGAPSLPSGLDTFKGMQEPKIRPVDDLSRFVMDCIIRTESEPRIEVPQVYNQPAGPMAHRYAAAVRRDCVAFRQVVALYVEAVAAVEAAEDDDERAAEENRALGLRLAVAAVATRWSDRPEFREEWKP